MSLKVDTSLFSQMVSELSKAVASPPEDVLDSEVGKILEKAAENTEAASVSKIRARTANARFAMLPGWMYAPKRKGRGVKIHGGKVLYNLKNRYPRDLWTKIRAVRERDLKARLRARGLSKQSWALIGDKLGIEVNIPGYARAAVPRTGRIYDDVEGKRTRSEGSLRIEIANGQPTVNAIGGEAALQKAIDGRVQFFITNAKRGVFKELERIARKYPGVRVVEF